MSVHVSLELKLQSIVTCHGSCDQTPIFCKNYKYSSLLSYLSSPNVFTFLNNASQLDGTLYLPLLFECEIPHPQAHVFVHLVPTCSRMLWNI